MSERYGAVVIGGGVVGLSAAWHLLRLGCRRVAVVERFRIGHDRGISHGSARMTRSTYASAAYAGLMRRVREEEWPLLERAAGTTLVRPADVVFFGDRAMLGAYAAAVQAVGADVERLAAGEARRRFPALRFPDGAEILQDRTGGVIAAAEAVRALARLVGTDGGVLLEDTRVRAVEPTTGAVRIATDRGVLEAERAVIASGAWIGDLVPAARGAVAVIPQTVAYVRLAEPAQTLPSWIHFGGGRSSITYALPEVGRDALKIGHHLTTGPAGDPEDIAPPSDEEIRSLTATLERILSVPVREMLGSERCLYTMTPTEDFIVDCWPGEPRIAYASACSGHGFKFAPLTGRLLAELVLRGRAELPTGMDARALFGLGRETDPSPIAAADA